MRLINTRTKHLESFFNKPIPKYAILSHTWGENEVEMEDYARKMGRLPEYNEGDQGVFKINQACARSRRDNFDYIWIDTCCIDKSSSAELSEAINSMFRYYAEAEICYVYLSDIMHSHLDVFVSALGDCRWWTRGWTLQELLAPRKILFLDRQWTLLFAIDRSRDTVFGARRAISHWLFSESPTRERSDEILFRVSCITGVREDVLDGGDPLKGACVAEKMSWSAHRRTTRQEDVAYCLLGIFDINMPLLYGEGKKAFLRLHKTIAQETDDQSLLAWGHNLSTMAEIHAQYDRDYGFFAPGPLAFNDSPARRRRDDGRHPDRHYTVTNKGIEMTLPLVELPYANGTAHLIASHCTHFAQSESRDFVALLVYKSAAGVVSEPMGKRARSFTSNVYTRAESHPSVLVPNRFFPSDTASTIYLGTSTSKLYTQCFAADLLFRRQFPGPTELISPCEMAVEAVYSPLVAATWYTDVVTSAQLLLGGVCDYNVVALELSLWPMHQAQQVSSTPRMIYLVLRYDYRPGNPDVDLKGQLTNIRITLVDPPAYIPSLVA